MRTKKKVAARLPPFQSEGRIEWAVLAPLSAPELDTRVAAFNARGVYLPADDDEPRSWCAVAGTAHHAAVIETAPGSACGGIEIAKALSLEMGTTIYELGFAGYDDPDHGLPYITRYDDGTPGLIWMAPSDADESAELETVPGPRDVPCDDPFDFADALGCNLRRYYDR